VQRIFLLFFLFAFFFIIDWYVFGGVKQVTQDFSVGSRKLISIIYWAVPILSILIVGMVFFIFPDRISSKWRNILASFVFIIYISKLLSAVVLIFGELVGAVQWIWSKIQNPSVQANQSESITRSEFITKTALALGATHIGVMSFGIISGAHDYRIRNIKVPLKNLPKEFDGIKIAQLSDIHSGSFYNKTAVNGGVDLLLDQKPDIVFFTGDLVNNKSEEFNDYFDIFKRVKAPLGVFSVLGNHDYGDYTQWNSIEEKVQNLNNLKEAHRLMGWDLILDEHRRLTVDNESIGLVGIQNWGAGGFAKYGDLNKAMGNMEEFDVNILLSHDPSHWREQVLGKTNIDIAFAGHTHGMQYGVEIGGFKWSPVQYRYKEWAGLYQQGEQSLYVNRGYGYIGYPGRVGILPEITMMTLVKA
jgi:uncharacterized protein